MSELNVTLSGEQLVQASSKTAPELPTGGLKEFQPTHSWLEKKQIQSALDQRKDLLEEPRVEKWSGLMRAEWLPEKGKAVVKQKTKSWEVFGHNSDNTDWLFPEEAVFLLELNCLECTYNEVPLSIQRSFSVLLGENNGCSLTEYRVYSHLSRLGYRVLRHLPDLTVTAYEKQIRLDLHMDQRTTYKTLPEAPSDTDPILQSEDVDIKEVPGNVTECMVEVIDIADSSEESSDSETDSEIEVVFETAGVAEVVGGVTEISDSDDEIDVVEVPVPPKQIEVATIESSESEEEEEEENSGSESERSYDGNWKRNSRKRRKFVRPLSMNNLKFLAVEEFCREQPKTVIPIQTSESAVVEEETTKSSSSNPTSTTASKRPFFRVEKSRNSILDSMPSMTSSGTSNKLMTVECPDLRFIPENITPKQQLYTFNTNSLKARYFNPARFNNRGRRNFNGSRFNNPTMFAQNSSSGMFPNPIQALSPLLQNTPLSQMYGSDIHSIARGMMQMASTILLNSSSNSLTNGYNPPQHTLANSRFESPMFNRVDRRNMYPENQLRDSYRFRHSNFQNHPQNQIMPLFGAHQIPPPGNLGFTNFDNISTTPNLLQNNPAAPIFGDVSLADQGNQGSSSNNRPNFNTSRRFLPSQSSYNGFNNLSSDPAYIKSDVPFQGRQNKIQEDGKNFIPMRPFKQQPIEIVEICGDDVVPKQKGISSKFTNKRKKKQQRKEVFKRLKKNQNTKSNPLEIVFLDSPEPNNQNENTIYNSVKQENNEISHESFKSEPDEESSVKQEPSSSSCEQPFEIKTEAAFASVKCEQSAECTSGTLVKKEDNSGIRVTLDNNGANIRVEINIENQSDTSSISSIPTDSGVKSEPVSEVKSEPSLDISSGIVKNESLPSIEGKSSVDHSLDSSSTAVALIENHPNEGNEDTTATSTATDSSVSENTLMDIPSELEIENSDEAINVPEISTSVSQNASDNSKVASGEDILRSTTSVDENITKDCHRQDDETCEMEVEAVDSSQTRNSPLPPKESSVSENSLMDIPSELEIENSDEAISVPEISKSVNQNAPDNSKVANGEEILKNAVPVDKNITKDCHRQDDETCEMEVEVVDSSQTRNSPLPTKEKDLDTRSKETNNRSSWAEMKLNKEALQPSEPQEDETSDEDEEQIMPLIRPKHCTTIGTVLSKLQMFAPFSPEVPSDLSTLKISFDLYLPTAFRKSQRGLPHFRISVFEGSETLPSAAQLHELQHRFSDGVSVLCAVVMPSSVVFYSCSDVSLPGDVTPTVTSN